MDRGATILSIDGIGAYDTISRKALMQGVADMVDGGQFYSSPSAFLWEDSRAKEENKVIP